MAPCISTVAGHNPFPMTGGMAMGSREAKQQLIMAARKIVNTVHILYHLTYSLGSENEVCIEVVKLEYTNIPSIVEDL